MSLHHFTIDMTTHATVVALGICATLCYIAWTGLQRDKHRAKAASIDTDRDTGPEPR